MTKNRFGYTLMEMMTVMVIFGVLTGLSVPRLQAATAAAGLRSAKLQVASYIAQARAVALQRGREARFVRSGDAVSVTVDSSGTQVVFARSHDLNREHGVSLSPSPTTSTLRFDPRGYAIGASSIEKFYITRAGVTDSVCVTKLGKVINGGCSL